MRTVYDFIRGKSALQVSCRNCGNKRVFDMRFLQSRLGLYTPVTEGKYGPCNRCGKMNVTLCAVDSSMAETPLIEGAFGGAYYSKE